MGKKSTHNKSKEVLANCIIDYESETINSDIKFSSIQFNIAIAFDELPKDIDAMTLNEIHAITLQKVSRKLMGFVNLE